MTIYDTVVSKADAAFASLVGQTVTHISIERWSMRVKYESAELLLEGKWQLIDRNGEIRDRAAPLSSRSSFDLWQLVANTVISANLIDQAGRLISIKFSGGWTLIVEGDDDGFEDWSLSADDQSFSIHCNGTIIGLSA